MVYPSTLGISIIVWKWSIHHAPLLAMFNRLHSKTNQKLYEKHSVTNIATIKMLMVPFTPVKGAVPINYHLKFWAFITYHCQLCMVKLLHSSKNQELFKKHVCNQSSYYKNKENFKGSHHVQPPSKHFFLSAKINGTQKKILVNSMKNAWYILWYTKRHLLGWSKAKLSPHTQRVMLAWGQQLVT